MHNHKAILIALTTLVLQYGCGGGGGNTPTSNDSPPSTTTSISSSYSSASTSTSSNFAPTSNAASVSSNPSSQLGSSSNSSSNIPNNSSASNATSSLDSRLAALTQKIDAYINEHQSNDEPGIAVVMVRDGKIIYTSTKGMANSLTQTPISPQTGFQLASVSKPFTAIAVMQLIETGQLHLNDSILDHIPELPASWRAITIDQLLSHRSGIYDIINDGWRPSVLNGMTLDELIAYLQQHPELEFTPGIMGDYSNTGFMLLAVTIERVTGMKFGDYMAAHIFTPANMTNSYINDEYQSLKNGDALNYANRQTYYGITTYLKGSMAQVSSINDFANFFVALDSGKLISSKSFAEMTTPHGTLRGSSVPYGYGISIDSRMLNHVGEWDGFWTLVGISPYSSIRMAILTNSGSKGRTDLFAIFNMVLTENL